MVFIIIFRKVLKNYENLVPKLDKMGICGAKNSTKVHTTSVSVLNWHKFYKILNIYLNIRL